MRFFRAPQIDANPELQAAVRQGAIIPWRVDAEGVEWFKTAPPIQGVPRDSIVRADLIDDDGEECEFFDDDGEIIATITPPVLRGVDPAAGPVEFV